jgi:hypothetical protein
VLGYERINEDVLGHLTAAAVQYDASDDDPCKSLFALASSASAAATRRAIVERLYAANARLDSTKRPDVDANAVVRTSFVPPEVGNVENAARGRVLLGRLAKLSTHDLAKSLDSIFNPGDAAVVQILCVQAAGKDDATFGDQAAAVRGVRADIMRRLGALDGERAYRVLWSLDREVMLRLCEADFSIYQGYLGHLLTLLWRLLEQLHAEDVQHSALAAEVTFSRFLSNESDVEGCRIDDYVCSKHAKDDVHTARLGSLKMYGRDAEAALKDVDRRLEVLLLRCGYALYTGSSHIAVQLYL